MSTSTAPVSPTLSADVGSITQRPPRLPSAEAFDADTHLCFSEPAFRYTMDDLKLPNGGISPVAVVESFPLFTPAGVRALREDILSDRVLDEHTFANDNSPLQGREFDVRIAPFTITAWQSPEVTRCVSKAAGIELEPIMEMELGHTNYYPPSIPYLKNLPADPSSPLPALSVEEKTRLEEENDISKSKQVVGWHYDAYPFACIVMLSDASTMVCGETAVLCGDGSVRKIRQPMMGFATVVQGRHVKHMACKSYHARERITTVTSYRAKDVLVRDDSWLTHIRPMPNKHGFNHQWCLYRLRLLAERFDKSAKQLEAKRAYLNPDVHPQLITKQEMQKFCDEQIHYLRTTFEAMAI